MTWFSIEKICVLSLSLALLLAVPAAAQDQPDTLQDKIIQMEGNIAQDLRQEQQDRAQDKTDAPIVIQLFTASDCSACIFADRILYDAMKDPNVIALSCLIKETAGADSNGEYRVLNPVSDSPLDPCVFRQWTYLTGNRDLSAYLNTPEFVFGNGEKVSSRNLGIFESKHEQLTLSTYNKTLSVGMAWRDADTITIGIPAVDQNTSEDEASGSIWLIRYKDIIVEKAKMGPNEGKVLRFSNVIQNIRHIGKWHGQKRVLDLTVQKPTGGDESGGYVILIQNMLGEPVIAAGKLPDYTPKNAKKN